MAIGLDADFVELTDDATYRDHPLITTLLPTCWSRYGLSRYSTSGSSYSPAPARASRILLEVIARTLSDQPEWRQEGFISARHLRHVQQRLADRLGRSHRTQGAATTLALAHLRGDAAVILNVGDSRVYQVDAQGGWRRLSKDHTLLQGMIDRGEVATR